MKLKDSSIRNNFKWDYIVMHKFDLPTVYDATACLSDEGVLMHFGDIRTENVNEYLKMMGSESLESVDWDRIDFDWGTSHTNVMLTLSNRKETTLWINGQNVKLEKTWVKSLLNALTDRLERGSYTKAMVMDDIDELLRSISI